MEESEIQKCNVNTQRLLRHIDSEIIPIIERKQDILSTKQLYMYDLFFDLLGRVHAIIELNNYIFAQTIASISRTIYEIALDIKLMFKEDHHFEYTYFMAIHDYKFLEQALKYMEANSLSDVRLIEGFKRNKNNIKNDLMKDKSLEGNNIQTKIDSFKKKHYLAHEKNKKGNPRKPNMNHWSGIDTLERAKRIDRITHYCPVKKAPVEEMEPGCF